MSTKTEEPIKDTIYFNTVATIRAAIKGYIKIDDKHNLYRYMTNITKYYPKYAATVDQAAQQYLDAKTYQTWQQFMLLS